MIAMLPLVMKLVVCEHVFSYGTLKFSISLQLSIYGPWFHTTWVLWNPDYTKHLVNQMTTNVQEIYITTALSINGFSELQTTQNI